MPDHVSPARRGWTAFRTVPTGVWAATAAFTALLAAWSILAPLYEAPDETFHADMVMHLADGGSYPDYDALWVSGTILTDCYDYVYTQKWCPTPDQPEPAETVRRNGPLAPAPGAGPTFHELDREWPPYNKNQMAQHPPLYYESMAVAVRAERFVTGDTWSLARELAMLRLVNVLLVAPTPLLAWWTARRLGLGHRVATIAAILPFAIPQFTHIGSTLNNDNMLVLFAGVATALAAGVIRGDRSWPTAVGLGLAGAGAMLTKANAVMVLVLIAVAYAVGWWDRAAEDLRLEARAWATRLTAVGTAIFVIAGWWYIRNKVLFGTFTPSIHSDTMDERLQPPGFSPSVSEWAERFMAWVPVRFFGWFGWFSAQATYRLMVAGAVVAGILVVVGLVYPRPGDDGRLGTDRPHDAGDETTTVRPVKRRHLAALFVIGPALLAFVVVRAWGLYVKTGQFPFLQGRYLFPAVVAGAVVAAAGAYRIFGRWAAALLLAWAAVMQVDGIRTVLRTYWGNSDSGVIDQVASVQAWARWPMPILVMGAIFGLVAMAALMVSVVADLRVRPTANP